MAATGSPGTRADSRADADGLSISSLLKRLGNQAGELVRAEMALAKLELSELARQAAIDGMKVGAAGALALVGAMAIAAAAVLGLGDVLAGRYGLAALIIGLVLLLIGGLLARSGLRSMAGTKVTPGALTSLRQDGQLVAGELRGLRQELQRGRAEPERPAMAKQEETK